MVVNNLPRQVRYKRENTIIVGIIPGPKEPKLTMNLFLQPLVDELKEFWKGVVIDCNKHPLKSLLIRAAIICCASDIPATRKLCGFVGHAARLGCSKCLKEFPSIIVDGKKRRDYSGYDKETWPVRDLKLHKEKSEEYKNSNTESDQKSIATTFGMRYSCLNELEYFNPIRFSVVDPMHNLYLGTAKHVMNIWKSRGVLSNSDFQVMEETVSCIVTPNDVGRIPLKIGSPFSGFSADQWKNWVTIFSPVVLKGLLDNNDLKCWLLFVRACCLLGDRMISVEVISQADSFLTEFCKQFLILYGPTACTPNLHLGLHLKECLLDYGPVHAFWCYSFERCNGCLSKFHTNNKDMIEVQLMRKFLRQQSTSFLDIPDEASSLFELLDTKETGSLKETFKDSDAIVNLQSLANRDIHGSDYSFNPGQSQIKLLPPVLEGVFTSSQMERIKRVYKFLYPHTNFLHYSRFYEHSKSCIMEEEIFTANDCAQRTSVVTAIWPTESLHESFRSRVKEVGSIRKLVKHKVKIMTESSTIEEKYHLFCLVDWYAKHPREDWYGYSAIVCYNFTLSESDCSFMPIQRILGRCAYGKLEVIIPPRASEKLFVAIPITLKY